ncbi:wall-associated receptor kinase-like 2 [Hevea brasiliensis]|uniref:wall-associated receptor kinase-like 2 n=1 Tax=Hevea brasiliensis TaxID=3981 RepID=UPI0025E4E8FD|nr:wall-associated receptor kinase-like 2 [Hevea brasiliensis]
MAIELVCQVSFGLALLLSTQLAIAAPPMSKPNCKDHCGNITIPYPFGMGKDCYLNKWFEIECNESAYSSRAFISRTKMEVFHFEVYGGVIVKSPVIYSNFAGRESNVPINLTGSPFYLSDRNSFIGVGCNTRALLMDEPIRSVGCDLRCHGQKGIDSREMLPKLVTTDSFGNNYIGRDCNGTDCCKIKDCFQSTDQVFNPILKDIDGNQSTDGCKLAFLAFDVVIQDHSYVQYLMILEWTVNSTLADAVDMATVDCFYYSDVHASESQFQCRCKNGYEGNAYIGCTDIDECKMQQDDLCSGITKCVNTHGSYDCVIDPKWIIIISICVGIPVMFVLILGAKWLYKSIQKRKKIKQREKLFKRMLHQQICSSQGNVEKAKIFSLKELKKATDHFNVNRIIGQGGQGTVYKGMLVDGRIVAVKKSKIVDEAKLEQFINEVVILSQINHRNVVKLFGCCLETEVPMLVYEFISNGTLSRYLHDQDEEFPLLWAKRLQIAIEISGALSYLHSAAPIPIFHRDIKSTNILLDEKYRAKVSDFGISRSVAIGQTHLTTNVHGTFGYLDPEYFRSSQFTEKSDVYSFGVVLVELLTGREPIYSEKSEELISLATSFIQMMENNKIFEIIDPRIIEQLSIKEEIMVVANLAKRCLNINGKKRPTMRQVTMELEAIWFSNEDACVEENKEENELALHDISAASTSTCLSFAANRALSIDIKSLASESTW